MCPHPQPPWPPGSAQPACPRATRLPRTTRLPPRPLPQDAAALRQQKAAGWRPKVGQSVFVPRLGKRAKVVAVDAASGALTLQAGLIKIQAAPDEVRQQ